MTWNPDAPIELLNRASRVYIELTDHAAYLNWLEQEVARTKIYLNYKTSVFFEAYTEAAATGAAHTSSPVAATPHLTLISELFNALQWYGNINNHIPLVGAMNSAISGDGGERARLVIEKHEAAIEAALVDFHRSPA